MAQSFNMQNLVSRVITEVAQVPGVAVQQYSSERIRQHIQSAIFMELPEMWWPGYMIDQFVALDGVTGTIVEPLQNERGACADWEDVMDVWPEDREQPIPRLNPRSNPRRYTTGGNMRFIIPNYTQAAADEFRPFRVLPQDSVGNVRVRARFRPITPMSMTDKIYMDHLLLVYDACWMYCVDDGTVPGQVAKFEMLAQKRREQCRIMINDMPILLDPGAQWESMLDDTVENSFFTLDVHPLA